MEEKEKDRWAEGVGKAVIEGGRLLESAMKCKCGCDSALAKVYKEEVMIPVIRKLVIDYLEMRMVSGLLKLAVGEGVGDEGITGGISTSVLN